MTRYITMSVAAAMVVLAACDSDKVVTPPAASLNKGLFESYVAIGNSITAGYQSGGILDSTQQESFAALLAHAAGTRYAYPALLAPGCPPPIVDFQTGGRLGGAAAPPCAGRDPSKVNGVLNNVAVPGLAVADLTSDTTTNSNALETFILGGKTEILKALDAQPTFVTVEIGNNDVLPAALGGLPFYATPATDTNPAYQPNITPLDSFTVQYARAINALTTNRPKLKGVLIGVFNVTLASAVWSVDSMISNPVLFGEFQAAVGHPVTITANCVGAGALISGLEYIAYNHTPGNFINFIDCSDAGAFTLDHNKLTAIVTYVNAYNAYIKAKADSVGFAYVDPNLLLEGLRLQGQIPPFPNFASATQPFGPFVTLDGIHPSAAAHQLIAQALMAKIDTVYGPITWVAQQGQSVARRR